MVLQRGPRRANIWGYAPLGTEGFVVTVTLSPGTMKKIAIVSEGPNDDSLVWKVQLDPVISSSPFNITANLMSMEIMLMDILFGDIWVCSGQSNMEFTMTQVFNATEELNDVDYPQIRLFAVNRVNSSTPLFDLPDNGIRLPWSLPTKVGNSSWGYFSAVCWLYGKYLFKQLQIPLGLVETCWGGTPVEAWSSFEVLQECGLSKTKNDISKFLYQPPENFLAGLGGPNTPMVLWNAMVHPLLNMTIYGAIWYQGEANAVFNRDYYNCTFPAMINDWRKKFHMYSDTDLVFPFGFVQLAGNQPSYHIDLGFPDIRWHQTADIGFVPNEKMLQTFMAVAIDLPDFLSPYGSIHPQDKQDVASRLVLGGLAVAYNKKYVEFQGPFPDMFDFMFQNYTLLIRYNAGVRKMKYYSRIGFEICCSLTSDNSCNPGISWWIPAPILEPGEFHSIVSTSGCHRENVTGARYAWLESPCPFKGCAVYDSVTNLPLSPFVFTNEKFRSMLIH
ncbi:hypothetical protein CHS0354_021550 [Potamilus streckersoni]|uniref:Sialate O-acetylesterase n=1 Tax=Potamilus streckersoni TaxID=2493646 RepID=A0AAE0SNX4_9BIVA|nr:hypothetical protein CHS0354_021550 [Potamilus streckersoni]